MAGSSSLYPEGEDDTPKSFWEQELEPGTGNRLELALSLGGRSKGSMLQLQASAGPGVTLDWAGVKTSQSASKFHLLFKGRLNGAESSRWELGLALSLGLRLRRGTRNLLTEAGNERVSGATWEEEDGHSSGKGRRLHLVFSCFLRS